MRMIKKAAWLGVLAGMAGGVFSVSPVEGQDTDTKILKVLSTTSMLGEVAPCG